MKISEREQKCLKILAEHYQSDQNCLYFRAFTLSTRLNTKQVRRTVRSLARKGLAEYIRGLFDEDGMVAGSGYCATEEGYDLISKGDKHENP